MVRRLQAKSPLARQPRPVRDLALGGHAAADPGRDGCALLRAIHRALSDRGEPRRSGPGRSARGLVRARLLQARTPTSRRSASNRHRRRRASVERRRAPEAAGGRPLYGGRGSEHCLRRADSGARRQRRKGGRPISGARGGSAVGRRPPAAARRGAPAARPGAARRQQPGAHGARRDGLYSALPGLRYVSALGRVPRLRRRRTGELSTPPRAPQTGSATPAGCGRAPRIENPPVPPAPRQRAVGGHLGDPLGAHR